MITFKLEFIDYPCLIKPDTKIDKKKLDEITLMVREICNKYNIKVTCNDKIFNDESQTIKED